MPDEPAAAAAKPSPRKGKILVAGSVTGVMVIEGLGIFLAMKMFGSGPNENAAQVQVLDPEKQAVEQEDKELLVTDDLRAINDKSGRMMMYVLKVYARVKAADAERAGGIFEHKAAAIQDTLSSLIRNADPVILAEAGLQTLRRQIKHALDQVTGDEELVQAVLIPSLMPVPAE